MDSLRAIDTLAALAQLTRLDAFRALVRAEPVGIAAGDLARSLNIPQNTMSSHLNVLSQAGLVRGERHSRSIIYRANLARLHELTLFLLKDCCGGAPSVCEPLIAELTAPCDCTEVTHG